MEALHFSSWDHGQQNQELIGHPAESARKQRVRAEPQREPSLWFHGFPLVMKIATFRTRVACPSRIANPDLEPIAAAVANFVTLEIRTDEGLEGVGYAGFVREEMLKPLRETMHVLAEWAVGEDPCAVESVSTKLLELGGFGAPAGLVTSAAAAIDVALWDIKAKAAGQPLYRLLGGGTNRASTYASGYLWRTYDAGLLASKGEDLAASGFRAMKFRMGSEPSLHSEILRMRSLRTAVGDGIDLMVDINQGWDVDRSIRVGRAMDECGLYWLEDPIHHQDYAGLAQIADALDTPISTGEYLYGLIPFAHMLEHRSVDIVMVDLLRVGGITHWMKAAHLAEAYNKPVVSHLAPEILAHCIAAAPNGTYVEHMPWALPLFKETFSMANGEIVLPEGPGLGLEFDHAAIDRFQPES